MSDIVELIEPTESRFLVAVDHEVADLAGGLIAPEKHREVQQMGTIVKCGPDCGGQLRAGRRIIFSRFSGMDFGIEGEIAGKKVKMLVPLDILGYIGGVE